MIGVLLLIAAIVGGSRQGGQQLPVTAEEKPHADAQTSEGFSTERVDQDATVSEERTAPLVSTTSLAAVHPAAVYKVDQITAQYDDNEVRAESIFAGKVVSIWGVIDGLTTGALGGADVTFDEGFPPFGGGHRSPLDCSVDEGQTDQLQTLHKGSIVVMSAVGGRKVMGTFSLNTVGWTV